MATIGDVLGELTERQRQRLADNRPRPVAPNELARSYRGDWAKLVADLSEEELLRALRVLPERELRVAVLRALDGHRTGLDEIGWLQDSEWSVAWQAHRVV